MLTFFPTRSHVHVHTCDVVVGTADTSTRYFWFFRVYLFRLQFDITLTVSQSSEITSEVISTSSSLSGVSTWMCVWSSSTLT